MTDKLIQAAENLLQAWKEKRPLSWQPDGNHDLLDKLGAALAEAKKPAEPSISKFDQEYWLSNRSGILDAINSAGFELVSNKKGFWLEKTGEPAEQQGEQGLKVEALALPGFVSINGHIYKIEGYKQQGEPIAYANSADIEKLRSDKWACVEVSAYKCEGSENIPLYTHSDQVKAEPLTQILNMKIVCNEAIPSGQISFIQDGKEVGRIVGIGVQQEGE